jgi:hypothetical protein
MGWLCNPATSYEVHDQGDHGKQQKQMDEETCGFEHHEAADP